MGDMLPPLVPLRKWGTVFLGLDPHPIWAIQNFFEGMTNLMLQFSLHSFFTFIAYSINYVHSLSKVVTLGLPTFPSQIMLCHLFPGVNSAEVRGMDTRARLACIESWLYLVLGPCNPLCLSKKIAVVIIMLTSWSCYGDWVNIYKVLRMVLAYSKHYALLVTFEK